MTAQGGTDRARMRAMNRGLVLGAVRDAGTTSQAELMRATGLSTGAIVSIVRELRARGLLAEAGRAESRGGRRRTLLTLNPSAALVLACRIGPGMATIAALDLAAHILARRELVFQPRRGPRPLLASLARALGALARRAGAAPRTPVAGVGLSLHGAVDATRGVMLVSDQLGWCDVDFREGLGRVLGIPVHAEAETRAIALAEQRWGAARGLRDFVLIELDAGIGMVQVLDGVPCRGAHSLAGELGFTLWDSRPRHGARPLERIAAASALRRGRRAGPTRDRAADILGLAVANVINLLDPELVILTGRIVARDGLGLGGRIRAVARRRLLGAPRNRAPRIEDAALGPDAALLGAAGLVIDSFLKREAAGGRA